MADRFCPNCGTEVDVDARFCPTCGQTLDDDSEATRGIDRPRDAADAEPDISAEPDIPAAPAWPPPEPEAESRAEPEFEPERAPEREPAPEPERPPPPPPPAASAPPRAEPGPPNEERGQELPFTVPTMLSGWLIGIGTAAAALSLLPLLGNLLNVLLFLALLGVAATVFLADRMPEVPRLRLVVLLVVMVSLGAALDRAAFSVTGVETIFLLATLAAAGGVLLVEFDRDQPLSPPGRSG